LSHPSGIRRGLRGIKEIEKGEIDKVLESRDHL
jgi:hypothetical protein